VKRQRATSGLVAGFDLGTTYFKVGLYDRAGIQRGHGRRAFEKDRRGPNRCEVPVDRFRQILKGALDNAVETAGCAHSDIEGVSYAAQANSFLVLGEHDEPLTPVIVWQDRRADPVPERIRDFWRRPGFLEATGLGLTGPEWMSAKLDWLGREAPEVWSRCRKVVTLSDYLALLMTGRDIGDSGTASLLGLWDLRTGGWYGEALELLGIAEDRLPELHRPGAMTVAVSEGGAQWLGLKRGIPFTVGGLDHHMAALGAGIGTVAPVSVSFGTSLVCLRLTDGFEPRAGCCMGPLTDARGFYQISFSSPGASALDDYRDRSAPEMTYEELLGSAQGIGPGADGLTAEIADGALRFNGAKNSHGAGHHVRAIMELLGRNVSGLLDDLAMEEAFRDHPAILAVGGGARSELWMRVVAEVSGVEVVRACPADTASRGAAMFSAVAAGWYGDVEACAAEWCAPQ